MAIHISTVLDRPALGSALKGVARITGKGAMDVKRAWESGLPVHSLALGEGSDFERQIGTFKELVQVASDRGIGVHVHWTDVDPHETSSLPADSEVEVAYALNVMEERLAEMRASGLYGL